MIHSAVLASVIDASRTLGMTETLKVIGIVSTLVIAVYFFARVGHRILNKLPNDETLKKINDSIIEDSRKNREAIEEITRIVQELKNK